MARTNLTVREGYRHSGLRQQPLVLFAVVLILSGAMLARLTWLQVFNGKHYRQLADENRIRLVPRSPIRGRLLDREGRVLASSKLTYSLYPSPGLSMLRHGRHCGIAWPACSASVRLSWIGAAAAALIATAIGSPWPWISSLIRSCASRSRHRP